MDIQEVRSSPHNYSRWIYVALYSLSLFFSAVYVYPIARAAQTKGYGWIGIWFEQIAITVISGLLVVQAIRSIRRARFINVLLMLIIGGGFILAFHLVHQPIEQFHFLQYGMLGILVFWALSGRPYTLQFYLLALNLFLLVGYLDEIIQGFAPNRFYDLEDTYVDVLSGALGFLLCRVMNLSAPLPLHPSTRSKHGVSTKQLPLIDLHIYWKDLLYLIPLVTILITDHILVTYIKPEDVIGKWTCTGSTPCTLTLKKDKAALLTIPQASCATNYGIEGDLLDGFRLGLARPDDLEETHQDCGISKAPMFHILKTAEGLSLWHKQMGILKRVI